MLACRSFVLVVLFPFRSFERFPHTIALSAVRRFLEIKLQLIGDLVRLRA